jgi:glucosylceramidase
MLARPVGPGMRRMVRVAALMVVAVLSVAGPPAAGRVRHTTPAAHLWLTTADGQHKLTDMGTVPWTAAGSSAPTIVVDPSRRFQTMSGFGGALTDSSATVLYRLSPGARARAMRMLFAPRTGDGLSYLRQPIGASDFVASAPYTYDDMPAGQADYSQRHFSIAHDMTEILPLLRQARRLNSRLQIIATPWSAPAWMKGNHSLIGGRLIDTPAIYRSYALYLTKFVQAYQAQGVTVNTITVQNEPQNHNPSGYPGMDMPAAQQEKLIEVLGPMLRQAGLHTQILAYDHNWSEHPNDIAASPPDEAPDINHYPQEVLSSPAARWVAGTAYHCYYGDPSAMSTLHNEFPSKTIFFTECSGSQSGDPANTFSDTLKWHSRNLIIGSPRNWAKTVINWNVALDPSGGPHVGGCGTCTGILTIGPGDTITPNAEYYTLGSVSRFVAPGAARIASTSFGTTGWNGQVMDVAFRNPDRSTVLVAHNENDNPQTISVREGDKSFTYTLPGASLATFTWPGQPSGRPSLRELDPSGWTASANPPGPSDPCCQNDVAANAVDDDASTRYSTGTGQAPGQYLQVDLGRAAPLRRIVFDTGVNTGDYPRAYTVTVSRDGTTWRPASSGSGSGQLTTVGLSGAPVRFVRMTLTAANGSWWSVADVRGYAASRSR